MKEKVVITIPDFDLDRDLLTQRLVANGFEVQWNNLEAGNDTQRIIAGTKGFNAIIAGGELLDRIALDAMKASMKIITRFGAGYDKIDMDHATRLGIAVANTPGMNSPTTGEHAVALMLAVLRGIPKYDRRIREDRWTTTLIQQLTGKTVGLVGFGAIAQEVAKLLQSFSTKILAYDVKRNIDAANRLHVEFTDLDDLLARADIVSLHTPLMDETRGMVNKAFLNKMKRTAILINTSRGKIIKESDLVQALQDGTIAGAGMDVFEEQPLTSASPLTQLDNVVMSSHIGGMSPESYTAMFNGAIDNILEYYSGNLMKNLLNPDSRKNAIR